MPAAIHGSAWFLMAAGYSYSGWTKLASPSWLDGSALRHVLDNPLARPGPLRDALRSMPDPSLRLATWWALAAELTFLPLALLARLRPWLWAALLLMHVQILLLVDFVDLSLGMLLLHGFTFDPAWIRARPREGRDEVFYDGTCGLCHRGVRFLVAEDPDGGRFRFAPLDSPAARSAVASMPPSGLPDSFVVRTAEGTVLVRSAAVRRVLERLGGIWRVVAAGLRLVPAAIRDRAYDAVAASRHRLFRRPADACPVTPAHLRARFTPAPPGGPHGEPPPGAS